MRICPMQTQYSVDDICIIIQVLFLHVCYFLACPPHLSFSLAVPQPLESRTVPVCKEKFCKQAGEIWSYLPNGQVILFL